MDKAYKGDIPKHRKTLVALKREFSRLSLSTDWGKLRVEPLLDHVASLDRLLRSAQFSREIARLRKGVTMFHSDLVYLRLNIKALKEILADEQRRAKPSARANRPNKAPEPTPPSVTSRAFARAAPAGVVAHL